MGTYWDPDVPVFTIYELSGYSRQVKDAEPHGSYDALFIVRLQETDGTRIGRQPDVPGPVIQDPGDGQQAIVWTFQVGNNEPVSVDFGQFGSAGDRRRAMAMSISGELRSHAPGLQVAAFDPDDDDCGGLASGCGGGGGGGGGGVGPGDRDSYEVSDHDTWFDKLTLHRNLDHWGDSELRLVLSYKAAPNHRITATLEFNNVDEGETIDRDQIFMPVSPVRNGAKFWLKAYESDPGPDDQLGKIRLYWNDSGKELEFDENDDDKKDLSVWLYWESDSDE